MNHNLYEIKATYAQTSRKRITSFYAKSEDQVRQIALTEGFLEPMEIKQIPHHPPTERQVEYANGIGISIDSDMSQMDVSALLSRYEDSDSDPNPELIEFADHRDIFFSKYIGKKALYDLVFQSLGDRDKVAFFVFSVYRYLSDDRHANLDTSLHRVAFYEFADNLILNDSFTRSLEKYNGNELRYFGRLIVNDESYHGGSTTTIAYKEAAQFLSSRFGLLKTRTKVLKNNDGRKPRGSSQSNSKVRNTGCLTLIIAIIIFVLFIKITF